MNQFKRLFGITRVPKPGCDILVGDFPPKSKHIVVLVADQIFKVVVYNVKTNTRLCNSDIESLFKECIRIANDLDKRQPPICILSAQDRDEWAQDHGHLLTLGNNAASFAEIESALFSVNFDHKLIKKDVTNFAKNVFHGFDGHNRWFDKSLSVIVGNDGRIGLNGEHSPLDALVPAIICSEAVKR
jgi:carnitine O-acetyltransferase